MISMKLLQIHSGPVLDFFTADVTTTLELPLAGAGISAGFPSPAEDFEEISLDLNKALVKHPAATFYARVKGASMTDAGIRDGDLLVIDKALDPKEGDIAVCFLDGEFTVKRIALQSDGVYLMPANSEFKPIRISEESEFLIWGIVTYIIHKSS
jgi:DNA polymerase V